MQITSPLSLKNRIEKATGRQKADLVIKNISILNVVTGETDLGDIAIADGTIIGTYDFYSGITEIDGTGLTAVPGFIDTHAHIESSMITPFEFDRCVLPRGTTTVICDPHEMSNVLGSEAIKYFQSASEKTVMDMFVQLSSCVPATPLETSGANLDASTLVLYRDHPSAIGLAEFMDIGGVLGLNPDTLEKLSAFSTGHIDGHLPGISGYALNAMASCGIRNCHESTTLDGAQEKLKKGLNVLIREGTVCKDLETLQPLIQARLSPFLGFCTDDRNPLDIAEQGHIDHLIRTSIAKGADPADVYRIASWSAAQGFGLHKNTPKWQARGLIAPGFKADIVILNDVATCDIHSVIKNGRIVSKRTFDHDTLPPSPGQNSVQIKQISETDFQTTIYSTRDLVDVIEIIPGQVVTGHLKLEASDYFMLDRNGTVITPAPDTDILKISVLERHGKNGNIATGFVKGFGFENGAIASSIGHDSHNITVVGSNDSDMALAVNTIRNNQGGYAIVKDGKVIGQMALPIAGLMSDKPFEDVRQELEALRHASSQLGSALEDPMMMLAFLPLCVIPSLKITDFGLVRFDPPHDNAPVLLSDQRLRIK